MDSVLDYTYSTDEDCAEEEEGRERCQGGCGRPVNVCLCTVLPSQAMETSTHIVILQHPHEARHKLATVPLLNRCLSNCQVIVGRRLNRKSFPILDNICQSTCQVLLLFPGNEAVDLNKWVSSSSPGMSTPTIQNNGEELKGVLSQSGNNIERLKRVVLLVIDGTWQHAKEMARASMPFLREIGVVQVCLPYDQKAQGNNMWSCELTLRKEPHEGCLSTMEAVARSLRTLEPSPIAVEIEQKLLSILHAMVAYQIRNLRPMRPRPKLLKKGSCPVSSS